jgi:hypothetical protein
MYLCGPKFGSQCSFVHSEVPKLSMKSRESLSLPTVLVVHVIAQGVLRECLSSAWTMGIADLQCTFY